MLRVFQQTYFFPGALAASHVIRLKMPTAAQLVHVSLAQASANIGTLKIGPSTDDDGYLAATNFPNNNVAEVATPAGFTGALAGGQFPHLAKGEILLITITDHASHMSAVNVVLTFTEG